MFFFIWKPWVVDLGRFLGTAENKISSKQISGANVFFVFIIIHMKYVQQRKKERKPTLLPFIFTSSVIFSFAQQQCKLHSALHNLNQILAEWKLTLAWTP